MLSFGKKKKNIVLLPDSFKTDKYTGKLFGKYIEETGVFNIFSEDMLKVFIDAKELGEISNSPNVENSGDTLIGCWQDDELLFSYNGESLTINEYNLVQNIFSRNTGILESQIMRDKCAFILGCGSVGSLIALELARAGVGKFVLIDNDLVEYHNICRHQCSILDVGDYKVNTVARRIREINPSASVTSVSRIVEEVSRDVFDEFCLPNQAIIIGCADNRTADVYANSIAISYGVPFISVGFWERAFAGEIFYHLPNTNTPCYKCALGDGGGLSQRQSTNRRIYTNEADLAKVNFEPGISVDINYVTTIGIKLILDILNIGNHEFTPRLLSHLQQYTLICNTNDPKIGGEMAEIFSYPLQVTTSLHVNFLDDCPPCEFNR